MKWRDARVEPPHEQQGVFVRGFLETGTMYFGDEDWRNCPSGDIICGVEENPFYATVRDVYVALNKELDNNE